MDSNRNKATGNVVRKLRASAGLTQTQLAERLGKPQSYVSKIESGERGLYAHELVLISRVMGASPQTVIADLDEALG